MESNGRGACWAMISCGRGAELHGKAREAVISCGRGGNHMERKSYGQAIISCGRGAESTRESAREMAAWRSTRPFIREQHVRC